MSTVRVPSPEEWARFDRLLRRIRRVSGWRALVGSLYLDRRGRCCAHIRVRYDRRSRHGARAIYWSRISFDDAIRETRVALQDLRWTELGETRPPGCPRL